MRPATSQGDDVVEVEALEWDGLAADAAPPTIALVDRAAANRSDEGGSLQSTTAVPIVRDHIPIRGPPRRKVLPKLLDVSRSPTPTEGLRLLGMLGAVARRGNPLRGAVRSVARAALLLDRIPLPGIAQAVALSP